MRNCIGFALLCPDKYKKTTNLSINQLKNKTNSYSFSRIFPPHTQVARFHFDFSFSWLIWLLWFWWYPMINARLQSLSCPAWQAFLSPLIWGGGVQGHGAKASDKRWTRWLDKDGKSPPLPSPAPSMFAPFCPMLSLDSLIAHASPVSLLSIAPWKRCLFLLACSFLCCEKCIFFGCRHRHIRWEFCSCSITQRVWLWNRFKNRLNLKRWVLFAV